MLTKMVTLKMRRKMKLKLRRIANLISSCLTLPMVVSQNYTLCGKTKKKLPYPGANMRSGTVDMIIGF